MEQITAYDEGVAQESSGLGISGINIGGFRIGGNNRQNSQLALD